MSSRRSRFQIGRGQQLCPTAVQDERRGLLLEHLPAVFVNCMAQSIVFLGTMQLLEVLTKACKTAKQSSRHWLQLLQSTSLAKAKTSKHKRSHILALVGTTAIVEQLYCQGGLSWQKGRCTFCSCAAAVLQPTFSYHELNSRVAFYVQGNNIS